MEININKKCLAKSVTKITNVQYIQYSAWKKSTKKYEIDSIKF
jgi:hypothetical protein